MVAAIVVRQYLKGRAEPGNRQTQRRERSERTCRWIEAVFPWLVIFSFNSLDLLDCGDMRERNPLRLLQQ